MNQFLEIAKFEYSGYLKNKRFKVTTIILVVIALAVSVLPQISQAKSQGSKEGKAAYILGDSVSNEARKIITEDSLKEYLPGYDWILENGEPKSLISPYSIVFFYNGGSDFEYYTKSQDLFSYSGMNGLTLLVKEVVQGEFAAQLPNAEQKLLEEFKEIEVEGIHIPVGGSQDAMQGFWISYVLVFLLYFVLIFYGQFVITSVITEKSTKAMELLITSAKPESLMFGKVVGVGLAALSQFILVIAAVLIGVGLNVNAWSRQMPDIFAIINSLVFSPFIIFCFFTFFLLGYFLYAFFYAAIGSTASRMEDAGSLATFPLIFSMIAFFASLFGGMNNVDSLLMKVFSFIPFFSPMVMFTRLCMGAVSYIEVIISMLLLVAGVVLMGILGAKIYKVGVMMYGKPPKIKEIFSVIKKDKIKKN